MTMREALARFPEGFERFDRTAHARRGGRSRPDPFAVTAGGLLSLDAATHAALGAPARVALLWDRDSGRIGLRLAAADDPAAYLVRRNGHRFVVSAVALCKALGIYGTARPLRATVEDGVLSAETREVSRQED